MKTFAIIAFVAQALPAVLGFCCSGPQCADGTAGTPCCATQSCNIFCCACGGHCRTNSKLLFERDPGEEAFALADVSGNGNLTMEQYLEFMGVEGEPQLWTDWFNKHDKNGDGVITEDEIDNA